MAVAVNDDEVTLLDDMVNVVMAAMADAFTELWDRPQAQRFLEDWLDERAVFVVRRSAIEVAYPPPECD